jgi:CheY-like chemotaxis protein
MELADALTESGWHVLEATTGEAALALLDPNRPIDLLVTDIRLPGPINGWDIAERYRELYGDVRVIYCSGNPAAPERLVNGSIFLPKPCRIDLLLKAANA